LLELHRIANDVFAPPSPIPQSNLKVAKAAMTRGEFDALNHSFSVLYNQTAVTVQLGSPAVLSAILASMEDTGGAYPANGVNLSFTKMGSSYASSPDAPIPGLRFDGNSLFAAPNEDSVIEMKTFKLIECFLRKLYSILFVSHGMDVRSATAGGKPIIRYDHGVGEVAGIVRHMTVDMEQRYRTALSSNASLLLLHPSQVLAHLAFLEEGLFRQTSSPENKTIVASLGDLHNMFVTGLLSSSSGFIINKEITGASAPASSGATTSHFPSPKEFLASIQPGLQALIASGVKATLKGTSPGPKEKRQKFDPNVPAVDGVYPSGRFERQAGGNSKNPDHCTNMQCLKASPCFKNHSRK